MDDLLALFDAENIDDRIEQQQQRGNNDTPNQKANSATGRKRQLHQPNKQGGNDEKNRLPKHGTVSSVVDDRFGIRMINRNISSIDLMSQMIDHPYHSTAQLCAYSLSNLNALLNEPTTIIDVATVNGRANLWTIGIIFSNTGSRIGPSGKAFCMITIGNLNTGPTITIMLFGTSYTTYCRTLRPGKVVALVNPRLLSPRTTTNGHGNDRTTLSFSITDHEQLLLIGDAQDYGICKGTATSSAKNEYGQWIPNSKPCKNYIDVRNGAYCTHHRKQQNKQSCSVSTTNTAGTVSSIQQLRNQAAAFPTTGNVTNKNPLLRSDQVNRTPFNSNSKYNVQPIKNAVAMSIVKSPTIPNLGQPQQPQNRYNSHQLKNPLLSNASSAHVPIVSQPQSNKPVNPYLTQKVTVRPVMQPNVQKGEDTVEITRDALINIAVLQPQLTNHSTKKSVIVAGNNKRQRLVNTDTSGFNGSVPIPAPAKTLFSQKNSGTNNNVALFSQHTNKSNRDQMQLTNHIITKQQMVASQLQGSRTIKSLGDRSNSKRSRTNELPGKVNQSIPDIQKDNIFGASIDPNERENIINAKSQFTSEVDAEEYARSRRVVCELEEQEYKVMKKETLSNNSDSNVPVIQKEWYCRDCQRHFTKEPIQCQRSNHRIKFERNIRTVKTKGEERMAMTEANIRDGGLVLGAGLDWSRFNSTR